MNRPPPAPANVARLRPYVAAAIAAIVDARACTPASLRRAAYEGTPDDPVIAAYVEKVRRAAYRVTDSDIDRLRAGGLDDDEVFEITVAAALGEAMRGLRAGLRLIGREP
jgi:hypothetical protein